MRALLKLRFSLILCLCIGLGLAFSGLARAGIWVSDPVIDADTQGHWQGVYGDCFVLIPNPTRLGIEESTGPDFFSQYPAQYDNACFEGTLFNQNNVDWRIFKTNGGPTNAFAWLNEGPFTPAPGAAQFNPCIGAFKAATWDDDDDANDPLVLELEINFTGSIKLAYYFLNAENVCRFEEFKLFINDEMDPRKVGIISDFESGKYVVFDIEDLVGETAIRLEVSLVGTAGCVDAFINGLNSHLSGVFINCIPSGITRTLGYWKNHPTVIDGSFDGPGDFPSLLPLDFCGENIAEPCDAVAFLSTGGGGINNFKRQGMAALLNCEAFGCPVDIFELIQAGSAACSSSSSFDFGAAAEVLDEFNNSGDEFDLPFQSPPAQPKFCK